jgi:hypothetical protein
MGSVGFQHFELETLRVRLRKMSDEVLLRFGRPATSVPKDCVNGNFLFAI